MLHMILKDVGHQVVFTGFGHLQNTFLAGFSAVFMTSTRTPKPKIEVVTA